MQSRGAVNRSHCVFCPGIFSAIRFKPVNVLPDTGHKSAVYGVNQVFFFPALKPGLMQGYQFISLINFPDITNEILGNRSMHCSPSCVLAIVIHCKYRICIFSGFQDLKTSPPLTASPLLYQSLIQNRLAL
jgi:hypothetical protein